MPSDLSSYLATHYLTADPKPSKKRKRSKKEEPGSGLIIADDDGDASWSRRGNNNNDDENDDGLPATVAGTSAEFRKAKKSGWRVVGAPAPGPNPSTPPPASDADHVLASAAAELAAASGAAGDDSPVVMMSDGTHAGLQTGAAVSAQLERRRRAERDEYERERRARRKHKGQDEEEEETVYRDATGRRVDASMKRAELRREAEAARQKQEQAVRELRGDAQVEEARRRREALDDAAVMGVARGVDDEDMNREMKGKVRWGDTMAEFVGAASNTGGGGGAVAKTKDGGGSSSSSTKAKKGRPIYQGAWAPNRYQIRPGYRWDGVDRSNGFEAERFKAINRRERNKGLEYSWQMDE
ncbi:Pre-mRNA-splicing factor of RES complex-domain-containing protein [Camillea tinctor]|nr:Pre-mRNA-splicing factor of RES complex-domain-containing protein [Camillea tinctor]